MSAAGAVVTLEHVPYSATTLDVVERRHENRRSAAALAQREHAMNVRSFREQQPRRVVTLADLEGRDLPTVAAAEQRILDLGGTIKGNEGRLMFEAPELFAPRDDSEHDGLRAEFLECVRVLVAPGELVIRAVEPNSRKPLPDRLPDKQAAAGGVIAP